VLTAKPELNNRGVVLCVEQRGRGQHVLACNRRAERLGVHPGMPLSEAISSSKAGRHTLHVEPHDLHDDRLALGELAVRCEQYSPLVGIEDSQAPESLLLDVTGVPHLFRGEDNLVHKIVEDFLLWNYRVRVAVADTLGAAWAAAHFLVTGETPVVLASGHTKALLNLPLGGLRLASVTVDLLNQLGISQIGQLAAFPRSGLKARFGPDVLKRLDQLNGRCDEIVVAHRPLPEFKQRWSSEHATTDNGVIERIVFHLLQRLTSVLQDRQQGIVKLECRFECEQEKSMLLEVDLYDATVDTKHLFELVRLQWERRQFAAPVHEIVLVAQGRAPLSWRQCELFADGTRENPRQLARLVDRFSSRLGRDSVVRPRLRPDAVPERSYVDVPLAGSQKKNSRHHKIRMAPFERPLCLLVEPAPIEVIAGLPDGPPAVFFYRNHRHDVAHHRGPERIETAWWRGPSIRRDYYRVETTAGQRFWLFRRLQDFHWFLHGEFD